MGGSCFQNSDLKVSPVRLHNGVAFLAPDGVAIGGFDALWYFGFEYAEPSILIQELILTTAASATGANSSSQVASSYLNITYSGDMAAATTAAASTTTVGFVSGSAAVESCYLEWASWITNEADWFISAHFPGGIHTESFETLTTTVYSTYTLCDGIPRIVLDGTLNYTTLTMSEGFVTPAIVYTYESALPPSPVILSTTTTVIPVLGPASVASVTTTFGEPSPTCQIAPSDCASLYVASSNAMFTGGRINISASPPIFACVTAFDQWSTINSSPCVVLIPIVQLL